MKHQTDELRQEIQQTREALGECIEQLATRAERAVDIRHQLRAHPWAAAAAAVTVGFLLGQLGNGAPERALFEPEGEPDRRRTDGDASWLHAFSWLNDDLDVLANAAARTAIGFVRDTIRREAPALGASMDRVYEERARRTR
jgi:hypothetical protein